MSSLSTRSDYLSAGSPPSHRDRFEPTTSAEREIEAMDMRRAQEKQGEPLPTLERLTGTYAAMRAHIDNYYFTKQINRQQWLTLTDYLTTIQILVAERDVELAQGEADRLEKLLQAHCTACKHDRTDNGTLQISGERYS